MAKTKPAEITVEQRLTALTRLQKIDVRIDKIHAIRGELPIEVSDLEDEIAGLETRIQNIQGEISDLDTNISNYKNNIKDSQALAKKYQTQQSNVKNNREYDALTKEIELQDLEVQAAEKKIREFGNQIEAKKALIDTVQAELEGRKQDLSNKKGELDNIVEETEKEERTLMAHREKALTDIEERYTIAYDRIRTGMRNRLAVVKIDRDACGGCFAKIPPQRQADIRQRKKITVCEHCGRILVDATLYDEVAE